MTQQEINDLMWANCPEWRKQQLIAEREAELAAMTKE
jgi:hypothetical protein